MVLLFLGCGSTSGPTNDAMDNNFTIIRGSVPGTLIEAFCDDGSYYSVNSTDDGSDRHPFELSIPKALNCRMVMSTNEDNISTKVITPIRIVTPDGNNTVFSGVGDSADLGYIDLALDRSNIIDSGGDGVSDIPLDVQYDSGTLLVISSQKDLLDSDDDGIIDLYEDDDGDGVNNHDDDDDDGDGIKDVDDSDDNGDGVDDDDSDGDGVKDIDDVDDENDGLKDEVSDGSPPFDASVKKSGSDGVGPSEVTEDDRMDEITGDDVSVVENSIKDERRPSQVTIDEHEVAEMTDSASTVADVSDSGSIQDIDDATEEHDIDDEKDIESVDETDEQHDDSKEEVSEVDEVDEPEEDDRS